jgi:hypothetical protein
MSVLNNALDVKTGSSQASRVYSADTLVWPTAFWTFNAPAAGTTISGSSLTLSAGSTANLGDGTIINMTAPTDSIDHTY